jgi:hypothetical protein
VARGHKRGGRSGAVARGPFSVVEALLGAITPTVCIAQAVRAGGAESARVKVRVALACSAA